jgi:sorting nexin-29
MILGSDEAKLERWAQHVEELLNGNTPERVEDMTMVQKQGNSETEEPVPTINEIEQAIKRLRNIKAPGIDLIPAKLVKFAVKIWITETIAEEWYLSIVCPIHKTGDVMVCSNYRGISLLCITYKIFSNILFNRLSPCVEGIIGDYQCGFRQGRSTHDQIFTIP